VIRPDKAHPNHDDHSRNEAALSRGCAASAVMSWPRTRPSDSPADGRSTAGIRWIGHGRGPRPSFYRPTGGRSARGRPYHRLGVTAARHLAWGLIVFLIDRFSRRRAQGGAGGGTFHPAQLVMHEWLTSDTGQQDLTRAAVGVADRTFGQADPSKWFHIIPLHDARKRRRQTPGFHPIQAYMWWPSSDPRCTELGATAIEADRARPGTIVGRRTHYAFVAEDHTQHHREGGMRFFPWCSRLFMSSSWYRSGGLSFLPFTVMRQYPSHGVAGARVFTVIVYGFILFFFLWKNGALLQPVSCQGHPDLASGR